MAAHAYRSSITLHFFLVQFAEFSAHHQSGAVGSAVRTIRCRRFNLQSSSGEGGRALCVKHTGDGPSVFSIGGGGKMCVCEIVIIFQIAIVCYTVHTNAAAENSSCCSGESMMIL